MENTCKICGVNKCRWDVCDACKEKSKEDPRVLAIRNDKLVGRGTCTSIDEAFDDHGLVLALNETGADTNEKAVKWAIADEGLRIENTTNYCWGEDDDPELETYRDWQEKVSQLLFE